MRRLVSPLDGIRSPFGPQFGFNPLKLFAAGEQGVWYDPSDFTTMFQDSAGTTPVTAVEQPVGLLLDKSKGLAGKVGSSLVNIVLYSEQLNNAVWTANNASVATDQIAAPDGTITADLLTADGTSNFHRVYQSISGLPSNKAVSFYVKAGSARYVQIAFGGGSDTSYATIDATTGLTSANGAVSAASVDVGNGWYRATFVVNVATSTTTFEAIIVTSLTATRREANTLTGGVYLWGFQIESGTVFSAYQRITSGWLSQIAGNHASQSTSASRPVLSARVNLLLATATLATQSVTTLAATYTLSFSGAGMVTATGTNIGVYTAGSNSLVCTAGTLTLTVVGSVTFADLRVTNDGVGIPAYQRVTTSTDYDTTGFPYYLFFDGTDDSMVTATFTPGTDKAQVFSGVRKLRDVTGIVLESGASISVNNGVYLSAPNGTAPGERYTFFSRGSANLTANQGSNVSGVGAAPDSAIITGLGDIPGDSTIIRRNGVAYAAGTGDQGTGNYSAQPLYIGRRGGTAFPYNGRIYSLIVRFGSNLDATAISNTETWVNGKTYAYA